MSVQLIAAVRTPFYRFKEYLHRRPDPDFDWTFVVPASAQLMEQARTLREDGIVLLPGYFSGDVLRRLQQGFERVIRERVQKDSVKDTVSAPNFLDVDEVFPSTALDDTILELMARYFRKPFGLGRVGATRLLPTAAYRDHSYQWHHDGRGRQLHLMILLTPVSSDGQRMKYLSGSHLRFYSKSRGQGHGTRFEKDIVRGDKLGNRVVEVTGPAGTVAVFDSNGLHSGTRNLSAVRDTVIYSYLSVRHCWQWKLKVRRSDFDRLPDTRRRVVTFNPHHQLVDV